MVGAWFQQILHDGSKELAQNELEASKYLLSAENKVCVIHSYAITRYFGYHLEVIWPRETHESEGMRLLVLLSCIYINIYFFGSRRSARSFQKLEAGWIILT